MSTDLVPVDASIVGTGDGDWAAGLQAEVEAARTKIESSDVPADVNDIRLRASAITGAANRARATALATAAAEVQTRAERRLGQMRSIFPKRERRKLDELCGVSSQVGWRFQKVGEFTDREFEAALKFMSEHNRRPSSEGIVNFVVYGQPKILERGIYVLRDGRLLIKWKTSGRTHTKTLRGRNASDVDYARRELAIARGLFKPGITRPSNLNALAADLQRLLQGIESQTARSTREVRSELREAIGYGQQMEQAIIRAFDALEVEA